MASYGCYSGLAIADYFVKKALADNAPITNMTVLKMIFFAHGLAYPQLGRKLIKDPFYAWQWGPVEVNTYEAFQKYGGGPIRTISGKRSDELKKLEKDTALTNFLDRLMPLARINPFNLSEKTHEKGSPWDQTDAYEEIGDDLIEKYYSEE
jgi:uncharacterized phage-associated protein